MSRFIGAMMDGDPLMILPLIALCLFFAVFVLQVVRLYLQPASAFDEAAARPLERDSAEIGGAS